MNRQQVALKFLPDAMARDQKALLRFQNRPIEPGRGPGHLAVAAFVTIFTAVALLRSPELTPNLLLLLVGQLMILKAMILAGFVQDLLHATHGFAVAFVIAIYGFMIALAGRCDFVDS